MKSSRLQSLVHFLLNPFRIFFFPLTNLSLSLFLFYLFTLSCLSIPSIPQTSSSFFLEALFYYSFLFSRLFLANTFILMFSLFFSLPSSKLCYSIVIVSLFLWFPISHYLSPHRYLPTGLLHLQPAVTSSSTSSSSQPTRGLVPPMIVGWSLPSAAAPSVNSSRAT